VRQSLSGMIGVLRMSAARTFRARLLAALGGAGGGCLAPNAVSSYLLRTAGIGAEQKLFWEIGCFRLCPLATISAVAGDDNSARTAVLSGRGGPVRGVGESRPLHAACNAGSVQW
jgi:hypothetical protein